MLEQDFVSEEERVIDKMLTKAEELKTALLVGVYNGGSQKASCEEQLAELERLADTYGLKTLAKYPCAIKKVDVRTYLGSGKLKELHELAEQQHADCIVFDNDISPSQQRNLEKEFARPVMDRSEVILGVFGHHAQTREARLQVELAQTKYQIPRLRRLWTHLSRQRGGGSGGTFLKGEGETQIEIDRRLLKTRVQRLEKELEEVRLYRETQRTSRTRSGIPTFAIVGYTNAGKSTLLNALTQANVLVEDKLFATLDTTTRKFQLPNNQDILLIDTVGFIRKLPHLLVAAFRSTLEEAVQADILLHLVDVSHPTALQQAEATLAVLKELNAEDKPIITALNKVDACEDRSQIDRLKIKYPKTVEISALNGTGFEELLGMMVHELSLTRRIVKCRIPQSEYQLVSELMRLGRVIHQEYEENDVIIRAEAPAALMTRLQPFKID